MSWATTLCLFVACTLFSTVVRALPTTQRFAIVIGNNQGEASSAKLRYADDDALATHRLLLEAGVTSLLLASFDEDSRRMAGSIKPHAPPRVNALERAISSLAEAMSAAAAGGATTELLFFFSGHGDIDGGEGFLVLEDRRLTRSMLFYQLSRSPATRNHVFIDACKSYFVVFDRGPGGRRRPFAGALPAAIPAQLANTGFVLSTSSDRDSHEWERYQGGILSHELRSALRGAADTNRDKQISYAELGAFLSRSNEAITNPRFRPDFLLRPPGGDLNRAVLGWSQQRPSLSFKASDWGHFYVETARGDRLLDAHPSPGQSLQLWVPDDRPLFVRDHGGESEYVVERQASVEVTALTATTPAVASRGALNLALEQLFALPFENADVLTFRARARVEDRQNQTRAERSRARSQLRTVSGIVALAGAGAGLALNGMAFATYLSSSGESQVRTEELNQRAGRFNRTALGCYAGASAAAGLWAWATFWPESPLAVVPATGTAALPRGVVLDVRSAF